MSKGKKMCKVSKKLFFIFFVSSLFAAVPQKINYQGRLLESGIPVNGDRQMLFKVFDAPTIGNELWSSGSQSITVVNGLFNYVLGEDNPSVFTSIDWGGITSYLEITIDGNTLIPREQILSVAYALLAGSATYATSAGDANTLSGHVAKSTGAGNIPIIGPDGKLDSSIIPLVTGVAPIVQSISPSCLIEGYTDTSVMITGEYFVDIPSVKIGIYDCIGETFVNSTEITATVPAGITAGTYYSVTLISDSPIMPIKFFPSIVLRKLPSNDCLPTVSLITPSTHFF